jgi:DNA modification methylase
MLQSDNDFRCEFISSIFSNFGYCKEIFLFGADYYSDLIPNKNKGSWIVWDKRFGIEAIEWRTSEFELCWSKAKHHRKICRVKWFGAQGTEKEDIKKRIHPNQKPILMLKWFFDEFGKNCNIIYDAFIGSGSILISCEQTNRTCFGCEISPKYCDTVLTRWEKFTGKKAELINANGN